MNATKFVYPPREELYPESDGKPMADNTLQWEWIVKIVSELRTQFAGQDVFVAGDLFWYPLKGQPKIVVAPDALIAVGRPPGYRGSYKQWIEDNVTPQVVFEVLSENNTAGEMEAKLAFYDRHGVEEYYFIDPYECCAEAYVRSGGRLEKIPEPYGFVSPRLGLRFEREESELVVYGSDGRRFQSREEREAEIADEIFRIREEREDAELKATQMTARADQEKARADEETANARAEATRADAEAARADAETANARAEATRADAEAARAAKLAARLRELGVDPDII